MECIALCEKHHLSSHQAKLCLAHIQVGSEFSLSSYPVLNWSGLEMRLVIVGLEFYYFGTCACESFVPFPRPSTHTHTHTHTHTNAFVRLQLQLGSPKDSLMTVKDCLLHCQANGKGSDVGEGVGRGVT